MCKEGVLKFKTGDLVEWPLERGIPGTTWRGIVVKADEVIECPHLRPSKTQFVLVRWFVGHIGLGEHEANNLTKLEAESA